MSAPPVERDPPTDGTGLLGPVRRGLGWSFVNNVAARLGNVAVGIVLARMLRVEDYGVFAVALVALNAALSMNELGVSLAVVRWPGPVSRIAPTVATLALGWSGLLYAACFLAAPWLASVMGAPTAVPLIRLLGVAVLVDAAAAVPAALITRAFLQRRRLVIDLTCLVLSALTSILLVAAGLGAWALVWGLLLSSVLSGVLTILWAPERHWPGFDGQVARELLAFGLPLAGASALMFLMLNIDYVVVGHVLGPVALGFYLLAFNLCSWPVNLVSVAIRRVSFAGFSRLADSPERSGEVFARAAGLVMAVTVPLCAMLAVYARPAVSVLYGDVWLPAATALPLLCVLGGARVLLELAYDYLAALAHTINNMVLQGIWFLLLIPALTAGASIDGLRGVAGAHALVAVAIVVPAFLFVLHRNGVGLRFLMRFAARPLLAGALVVLSGLVVTRAVPGALAALLVGCSLSAALALLILYPMRRLVSATVQGQRLAAESRP